MKRKKGKWYRVLPAGILTTLALCGCGSGEQTKTIVLPPLESQNEDAEKLGISRIREYVGEGREEDRMCLTWGEPGTDRLYLAKIVEGRYLYQAVDTRTDEMVNEVPIEDPAEAIRNLSISPGGRYVAYEVEEEEGMKLVVFSPMHELRTILKKWADPEETFSYVWTDDGTKLVFWQNGDTKDPTAEWVVGFFEPGIFIDGGGAQFVIGRAEFAMEGHGRSWRIVLPNADGSEIYVREQFRPFNDGTEDLEEAGEERSGHDAFNWLLLPNTAEKEELPEYSKASVYPVKYTPAGLFVQDAAGSLHLIENIRSKPVKKELITADPSRFAPTPCICENGDHVFLVEWLNYSLYQISGIRVLEGRADGDPVVLYQDNYDSLEEMTVQNDRTIVFWGRAGQENGQYHYKVTELEY